MWQEAEEFLSKDKYIAPLIKKWGHCSIRKQSKSKYYIDLVDAICSQQLSGKAAKTIFDRVKVGLGGKITPENVLAKDKEDLRKCGLSYSKITYIKDLSDRFKNYDLGFKNWEKLDDEEIIQELVAVKGIGRWTAKMFLMFSLARPDVFPLDDLGIKKGFEKVTGKKWDKIKPAKFAEKYWKPYRTIASWYLWRSLENR